MKILAEFSVCLDFLAEWKTAFNLYAVFRKKHTQNLLSVYQKAYFDVKKQLQFERAEKLWKEVKDDSAKYKKTITELKLKGQIRKFKQISFSYWSTLKPNTLNETAIQNENDSKEQHACS